VVRLSPAGATSASLEVTAPSLSSTPEQKTLALGIGADTFTVALSPGNTGDASAMQAALAAALGSSAQVTVQASSGTVLVTGLPLVALDGGAAGATLAWPRPAAPTNATLTINGRGFAIALAASDVADDASFQAAVASAVGAAATVDAAGGAVEIVPAGPVVTLSNANDTASLLSRLGVGAGALSNTASSLELLPPQLSTTGETEELVLGVDDATFRVPLTPSTSLQAALAATAGLDVKATIAGSGNGPITITSKATGTSSRVKIKRVVDPTRWTFSPSDDEQGADGSPTTITAAELVGLISSLDGAVASASGGKLTIEAIKVGSGSTITASGALATLVFASSNTNTISGTPGASDRAGFSDADAGFKSLVSWNHELQKLPEDTRNLTRPLTEAIDDTLAAATALEGVAKTLDEGFVPGDAPPPEAIGLLSPGVITLGTSDRIVGSGGKGIVFISDGGTGAPDRAKFVATEGWVADIGAWSKSFFEPRKEKAKEAKRSLGFRVLSDSAVDMSATTYAQLAALGRGTVTAARPDGSTDVGIGIARVLGSYAAEVAGYEKVVISARSGGKAGDEAGATGGRVELLGQRVVIGAARGEHASGQKFTDFAQLGTMSLALDGLDGAEHLADGEDGDKAFIKNPLNGAAWSPRLRALHPQTTHVDIHAAKSIDQAVLPYRVQLTPEMTNIGVVPPVVADRRAELSAEATRLNGIKDALTDELADRNASLLKLNTKLAAQILERDNPLNVLSSLFYARIVIRTELDIAEVEEEIDELTEDLAKATVDATAADLASSSFANDWDAKAFPRLEITEDRIRFGFVAGDATWEDFAYMEITKDGIKMFQPKSKAVPTFDLAAKSGTLSDGTADTVIEAKDGKLNLKFKDNAKSGPLTWDAQGNVKIG
jgi:hypothetical protein